MRRFWLNCCKYDKREGCEEGCIDFGAGPADPPMAETRKLSFPMVFSGNGAKKF